MKRNSRAVWGVILIAAGIVWILSIVGVLNFNLFFEGWWTLFIIIPCGYALFTSPDKVWPSIGLGAGILLLLSMQDIVPWDRFGEMMLAVVAIAVGAGLLFGHRRQKDTTPSDGTSDAATHFTSDGTNKRYTVRFGYQEYAPANQLFDGIEIDCKFGAFKLDLRDAIIQSDVAIQLDCSFCGVDILLPEGLNLSVNARCSIGGVEDKRFHPVTSGAHTIHINGNCSFSGIQIS